MNIMTYSPSGRTIICQEVFDENSQPSEEEVLDYAKRIGINPEAESHLLSIARDGLMRALPPGWKPVYDDKLKRYYYFNFNNRSARWDHPLDDHFKELVKKKRAEGYSSAGEEDSKTSIKEDLKSYEEQVDISEKMTSSQSQGSQRFIGANKNNFVVGSGLPVSRGSGSLSGRPPLPPRRGRSRGSTPPSGASSPRRHQSPSPGPGRPRGLRLSPSTRDTGQLVHSPSPTRIDIDSMAPLSFNMEQDRSPQEKLQRPQTNAPGLTLSGGGSMFLKSKQKPVASIQKSPRSNSASEEIKKSSIQSSNNLIESAKDKENKNVVKPLEPVDDVDVLQDNLLTSKRFENVRDFDSLQSVIDDSSLSHSNRITASYEQTPSQDMHPLKGILRDSSVCSSPTNRILWDVEPQNMTAEEKIQLRNQELEEERKRSVRFADFEKQPLDIRFEVPDSEGTPSTSSEDKGNWDSDIDDRDDEDEEKLNAGSSLDTSPLQNEPLNKIGDRKLLDELDNENKMDLIRKDYSKIYTVDKLETKNSWMEMGNENDVIDVNCKEERELMNRLVKLEKSGNEVDEFDNDIFNESKPINKKTAVENLNVDETENNNYPMEIYKTDVSGPTDVKINSKRQSRNNTNRNNFTEDKSKRSTLNNVMNEITPDSEIMLAGDDISSSEVTDNYKKLIESNRQLKSSTRGKIVKSTIDYLLRDTKTNPDAFDLNEITRPPLHDNSDKNQNRKKELLSIDNEILFNKKSKNKLLKEEYKERYLIDEEMFHKRDNAISKLLDFPVDNIHLDNSESFSLCYNEEMKGNYFDRTSDEKFSKEANNSKLNNENLNKLKEIENIISDILVEEVEDFDGEKKYKIDKNDYENISNNDRLEIDFHSSPDSKSAKSDKISEEKDKRSDGNSGNSVSPLDDTVSNEELLSSNSNKIKTKRLPQEFEIGEIVNSYESIDVKDIALVQKVEELLENFQGKLAKNVKEKILNMEKEQMEKLEAVKIEFENKALIEREKLENEMIERLTSLKKLLQEEELKKIMTMREEADLSLQEIKNKIKEENDEKIKHLGEEQKKFLEEQEELSRIEQEKIQEETNNRVQMSVHILAKFVEEMKQREEKEIERLKSESDEKLETIKKEYQIKEEEFAEKMKREMEVVESELDEQLNQLKERCKSRLEEENKAMETVRKEFAEKKEAEWRKQQEELLHTTDEHRARMEVLREECKQEEEMLKKKHAEKIESLTAQINRTLEKDSIDITQLTRDFEKVRCEKRLLEDKYQVLKEKYVRLKSDVRLSLERKRQAKLNRKNREQAVVGTEETDRSTSHSKTEPRGRSVSPKKKCGSTEEEEVVENTTPKTIKRRPKQSPSTVNSSSTGESCQGDNASVPLKNDNLLLTKPKNVCDPSPLRDRREGMDTEISSADEFSFASFPNEHVKGNISKGNKDAIKHKRHEENSPLQNLKNQLEKLDELEEQFPLSTHTDTYLRYPFSGPAGSSCELEFYRHRLHLERESVRRAKQSLSEQRNLLETKQIQFHHKQSSSTLQQLQEEERDLTDMEVHLHRTKSLLGEKIIRLKHLELSLEQLSPAQAQFSPSNSMSEPSHSSGFSGSDVDSAAFAKVTCRPQRYWTDASFNVLQSLENINCEIREIWTILGKHQIPELGPPPSLQFYDSHQGEHSNKMITDQYYIRSQTADIADRTRGLRDWLTKVSAKNHIPSNH